MRFDFPCGDQDILNIVFKGSFKILPQEYNCIFEQELNAAKPIIFHYAGPNKPWNVLMRPNSKYWWENCKETPLFDSFFNKAKMEFYSFFNENTVTKDELIKRYAGDKIVIYGAGWIGKSVIKDLIYKGIAPYGIAVTSLVNAPKSIGSIEVKEIKDFYEERNQIVVFVSFREKSREIVESLRKCGYTTVVNIQQLF